LFIDVLLLRLLFLLLLLLLLHLVLGFTAFCSIELGCKVLYDCGRQQSAPKEVVHLLLV